MDGEPGKLRSISAKSADSKPASKPDLATAFRDYHGFVWRTLHHMGLAPGAVDDATQDVFLVAHRRLEDFDAQRSMKAWLYGIARRVASDHRRGRRRRARRLTLVPDPEPQSNGVSDAGARVEAADLVQHFLADLDANKREVFLLCELEGMTAPEIAEALTLNVNTVYARIRAARRAFERSIQRQRAKTRRLNRTAREDQGDSP